MLFASQAATAIANARTHRDELRAPADLDALVDTSPVGVVVFDAKSGRPVSFSLQVLEEPVQHCSATIRMRIQRQTG